MKFKFKGQAEKKRTKKNTKMETYFTVMAFWFVNKTLFFGGHKIIKSNRFYCSSNSVQYE